MEYRVKLTEKYNGEKAYIPQYRDEGWTSKLTMGVILLPILFLFSVCHATPDPFIYFFSNWRDIEYRKNPFSEIHTFFHNNSIAICESLTEAEEVIKYHKKNHEEEVAKKWEEEKKRKANEIMKTSYMNYYK